MKIRKLLLCLMILLPTYSFSQTTSTITITPEQLKTTNLIFLEHEKYTKEVPLLNKKIETLEKINKSWLHTDSIRKINEKQYNTIIKKDSIKITQLQSSHKKYKVVTKISIILNIILACLLVK
nr:MAG TPA: hypothetical protein [Crassvirales sp.]DAO31257.1 MAG TPA: hypothetical protein [Crassvirales sp.]